MQLQSIRNRFRSIYGCSYPCVLGHCTHYRRITDACRIWVGGQNACSGNLTALLCQHNYIAIHNNTHNGGVGHGHGNSSHEPLFLR